MGWHTPPMPMLAIAMGLLGLGVMLGAKGEWLIPRSAGEWMALLAGLLWSVATTGMRVKSALPPVGAACIFALGASLMTLFLAPFLHRFPQQALAANPVGVATISLATGGAWWALSIACLMWATPRLEPARVGILLMAEVLIGAVSAALLAGETLSPLEIAGSGLVLLAGLLELWPKKPKAPR